MTKERAGPGNGPKPHNTVKLQIEEKEIQSVRVILLAAYLLAAVVIALVVYTRGELAEWMGG